MRDFKVLLLTTVGRKSEKKRTTPLGYIENDGGYVIAASHAGLPGNPGWYFNLKNTSEVTIQVKDRVMIAVVEIAEGDIRDKLWEKFIEQVPSYEEYQKRTTRKIPMIMLMPKNET